MSRHAQRGVTGTAAISEKAWQQQVIDLAKLRGWRVYHTYDSRRSTAGFPDLVMLRGKRMIAMELKGDGGRATMQQAEWLAAFAEVGAETFLCRPRDLSAVIRLLA